MLAIRLGYYSFDYNICWAIDSLMDFNEDIYPKFISYIQNLMENGEILEDKLGKKWVKHFWMPQINFIEKRLRSHMKHFVAGTSKPTCADFKCF